MADIYLDAEPRTIKGKQVKQLRQEGVVPAVVYGRLTDSMPISVAARPLNEALNEAGSTQLIKLQLGGETHNVLVRDVQRDVLTQEIIHADLYEVVMTDLISTQIPLVLVGTAPAVREMLGVLVHALSEVEVECLPGDLVSHIEVDVTSLTETGSQITVGELTVPPGITFLTSGDEVVATIASIRPEEEEEVEEEEEFVEPTVVGRVGREEEEEEGEEA